MANEGRQTMNGSDFSGRGEEEVRAYRSDDRDLRGCDNELRVFSGGNGDWYVSIVGRGDRIGPAVRITTSGTPRGFEHVPVAIARLYRALGGERLDKP
jgi:hypothetical protein